MTQLQQQPHISVMKSELVDALNLSPGDIAIDCTLGAGGHTELALERVGTTGMVVGIDCDDSALALVEKKLQTAITDKRLLLVKSKFSNIADVIASKDLNGKVAGIMADIGVSSMHLDQAERGFSFAKDGPLDMRMDPTQETDASSIVNEWDEKDLTNLFWKLGEEPKSRYIARAICERRSEAPITTTLDLANLVAQAVRYNEKSRKHPATKVFQALRIAVNGELDELEQLLEDGFRVLKPGGRLAIISFHSLEDRIVKTFMKQKSGQVQKEPGLRGLPFLPESSKFACEGRIVKPFPAAPSDAELSQNPRARSAKLRVIEKIKENS